MPSFESSLKDQIKQSVDIVQLVGEYLVLQRAGRVYKGLCPFHDDHRPSLTVDPDRQSFKCWSCGKGGDVIAFVQEQERVGFPEALQMLAERAGIRLRPPQGDRRADDDRRALYSVLAWAEAEFHQCLLHEEAAEPARRYLRQRGIAEETTARFRLGFQPYDSSWLQRRARTKRFKPGVLARAGLVKPSDYGEGNYEPFKGRLMFPIRDMRGRPVAFGARVVPGIGKSEAKYVNSSETPLFTKGEMLYGFDLARRAIVDNGTAILVEGYTDCIVSHQFGLTNVLAPLGTALTPRQVQILKRHAQQVVLVFDGDQAGGSAAERALELFIAHDLDVRIATLPAGKDPCDLLQQGGKAALEEHLGSAPDALEHMLERCERTRDFTATHARYEAARQLAQIIARAPRVSAAYDSARRMREWMVLDKVAQRLQVPEATFREQIAQARQRGGSPSGGQPAAAPTTRLDPLERELLEIVLVEPSYAGEVSREVPLEVLGDSPLRVLLSKCYELAEQGVRPSYARLTAELEDLELKRVATDVDASSRRSGNVHERLEAVLEQFRRRREARRAQALKEQLRESASDAEKEMELLRQCHDSKRVQQQIV